MASVELFQNIQAIKNALPSLSVLCHKCYPSPLTDDWEWLDSEKLREVLKTFSVGRIYFPSFVSGEQLTDWYGEDLKGVMTIWYVEDIKRILRERPQLCQVCGARLVRDDVGVLWKTAREEPVPYIMKDGLRFFRCPNGRPGMPILENGNSDWSWLRRSENESRWSCGSVTPLYYNK